MANVEINYALKRSHIPRLKFTADGSFAADGPVFKITCNFKKNGAIVKTVEGVPDLAAGKWVAPFPDIGATGPDYVLAAHITGAVPDDDEQTEIVVDEVVVIGIDKLPPPPNQLPPDSKDKKVPYEVRGTFRDAASIFCVAFLSKKQEHHVIGEAVAMLNKPKKGQWTAKFMIPVVPAGKKIGVMATAFNADGVVIGRVFKRR